LPDGEDWLLAPVLAGMCQYESLTNGALDLADIALMNDALIVKADNEEIARKRAEKPDGAV
jgi:hypothetical protein